MNNIYKSLIELLEATSNLPHDNYPINVINDKVTYNFIDTFTGDISYSEWYRLDCGCCDGIDTDVENIKHLDPLTQFEILLDLYDTHIKK